MIFFVKSQEILRWVYDGLMSLKKTFKSILDRNMARRKPYNVTDEIIMFFILLM